MFTLLTVGEALTIIRKSQQLTQNCVAEQSGLSRSFLSELENNKKKITVDSLVSLSKTYEVQPSEVFFFLEDPDMVMPSFFSISIKKAQSFYLSQKQK